MNLNKLAVAISKREGKKVQVNIGLRLQRNKMKLILTILIASLTLLTGCSSDADAAEASATQSCMCTKLGKAIKRQGSWCDATKQEVSLGFGYVTRDDKSEDMITAVTTPDAARDVMVTFCAPLVGEKCGCK